MTDATTTTLGTEPPIRRDRDEILQTRKELTVSPETGMLSPDTMEKMLEFSQGMAKGEVMIPKHLRGSPGACLGIIEFAHSYSMSPYALANSSYVVGDRAAFMSVVMHAVIKKRVPLKYPALGLEAKYEGEGPTRRVIVFAEIYIDDARTVTRVLEMRSPMVKDIPVKNSPLWKSGDEDVDLQLFYRTTQFWRRRYFPEVMLGMYSKEEWADATEDERAGMAKDVTPQGTGLVQRLGGPQGEGFRPENFDNGVNGKDHGTIVGDPSELANVASEAGGDVAPAKPQEPQGAASPPAATETAPEPEAAQAPARRKPPAKKKGGEAAVSDASGQPVAPDAPAYVGEPGETVPTAAEYHAAMHAPARPTESSSSAPPAASTETSPAAEVPPASSTPATQAAPAPAQTAPLPTDAAGYIAYMVARIDDFSNKPDAWAWYRSQEQMELRKACVVDLATVSRSRDDKFRAKGW